MKNIIDRVYYFLWRYYPLSSENIIRRNIKGSLLNIGCKDATDLDHLNAIKPLEKVVSCDIHLPFVEQARKKGWHVDYQDIRQRPYQPHSFDTVTLIEVIEHMEKDDSLLCYLESLGKVIIMSTPRGFSVEEAEEGILSQKHLSAYDIKDFKNRGYSVYGSGLRFICNRSFYKSGKIPPPYSAFLFRLVNFGHCHKL